MNQIQKNAKDINSRLEMIENTTLFKQPPPKIGGMLPDAKVCQVLHTVLTLLLERLRFTFTENGKRQIQVENFSE